MSVNQKTIDLVKKFEGCKLKAYLCPANIYTIGWGNTFYKNGTKVKRGDIITQTQADELLKETLAFFAFKVQPLITAQVNENQFGALVSFAYNCGVAALSKSTLLAKVNQNPNNDSIGLEFLRWTKAKGVVLPGLVKRRQAEKELYFS